MAAAPQDNEVDSRSPGTLIPTGHGSAGETAAWAAHLEWGPGHMLNDMGPSTVIVTADDLEREATALSVQNAVQRAIEKGEHYEYDE